MRRKLQSVQATITPWIGIQGNRSRVPPSNFAAPSGFLNLSVLSSFRTHPRHFSVWSHSWGSRPSEVSPLRKLALTQRLPVALSSLEGTSHLGVTRTQQGPQSTSGHRASEPLARLHGFEPPNSPFSHLAEFTRRMWSFLSWTSWPSLSRSQRASFGRGDHQIGRAHV